MAAQEPASAPGGGNPLPGGADNDSGPPGARSGPVVALPHLNRAELTELAAALEDRIEFATGVQAISPSLTVTECLATCRSLLTAVQEALQQLDRKRGAFDRSAPPPPMCKPVASDGYPWCGSRSSVPAFLLRRRPGPGQGTTPRQVPG